MWQGPMQRASPALSALFWVEKSALVDETLEDLRPSGLQGHHKRNKEVEKDKEEEKKKNI